MKVGIGYDVHKLVANRRLMLGGVEVPYHSGLMGHSDADVLLHAICDAILGAISGGDIGKHFPPTDPQWTDISSMILLQKVYEIAAGKGYRVKNVDSVIIAERPKLIEFIPKMIENIANVLKMEQKDVNVKATTVDGLGVIGKGGGMGAQAIVTVEEVKQAQSQGDPIPFLPPLEGVLPHGKGGSK